MEEILARMAEIRDELAELADLDELDETQEARFGELTGEFETLEKERAAKAERAAAVERVRQAYADPRNRIMGSAPDDHVDRDVFGDEDPVEPNRLKNPWDLDAVRDARLGELKARARSAIEQASGFTTRDREILTGWVDDMDDDNPHAARLARHILATSSPEYVRAWRRAFKTGARMGQPDPEAVRVLSRAMSLTDSAGGYAVPQQLDPALILTSDGTTNPVRQVARVVQATGDTWTGLSTTHASWSNDAEAAEVSDDATTFAQPSIPVHKAQVFIPFSLEIDMDYPGFTEDLRQIIAMGKDDLDAANFITGTGSGQPTGIVTALTGGSSVVASATTDTFAIADVYSVHGNLPAKYRRRAAWLAEINTINSIRQFDTAGGAGLLAQLGDPTPEALLGSPLFEASEMDGTINATQDNYILVYGDWSNYVIADRVGMTLELVPHLFATANNRPSGQRGFYGFARTGADSVNDGAFRMLNVT